MILELTKQQIQQGNLILVNRKNPWKQQSHEEHLTQVGTQKMEKQAGIILKQMLNKINANERIVPVSGFRKREEQAKIYKETWASRGQPFADTYVALPGCSEHETGLAIDLARKQEHIDFVCPDFPFSGICQYFREKAPFFGFIQRYPMDKEAITGIGHEP